MTKPLQGEKFRKFRDEILGQSSTEWNKWVEVPYMYLKIQNCVLNYWQLNSEIFCRWIVHMDCNELWIDQEEVIRRHQQITSDMEQWKESFVFGCHMISAYIWWKDSIDCKKALLKLRGAVFVDVAAGVCWKLRENDILAKEKWD